PCMVSGNRPPSAASITRAPICSSGSSTRRIGRPLKEASPTKLVVTGQPATGAGIAEIERSAGLRKSSDANAMNSPQALGGPFQPGAERAHGRGGMQDVLAFQQAGNRRFTDPQGPENQGTMRNRFVARYPGPALQGPGAAGDQRCRISEIHGAFLNVWRRPTTRPLGPSSRGFWLFPGTHALLTGTLQLAKSNT